MSSSMEPVPVKFQTCGICEWTCAEEEWLDHLIKKPYLRKSRRNFVDWKEDDKMRAVLVFSSFPLVDSKSGPGGRSGDSDGKLTQDASGVIAFLQTCQADGVEVIDFCGWEEKPFVGVVQMKTRAMTENMLISFGGGILNGHPARISLDDDHLLQFRLLSLYGHLELMQILPEEARILSSRSDASKDVTLEALPSQEEPILILNEDDMATRRGKQPVLLTVDDDEEEDERLVDLSSANMETGSWNTTTTPEPEQYSQKVSQPDCEALPIHSPAPAAPMIIGSVDRKKKKDRPIHQLNKLAKRHHWKQPQITVKKVPSSTGNKFLGRCTINGVLYEPDLFEGAAPSTAEAEKKAAQYCLKRLSSKVEVASISSAGVKQSIGRQLGASIDGRVTTSSSKETNIMLREKLMTDKHFSSEALQKEFLIAAGVVKIKEADHALVMNLVQSLREVLQAVDPVIQVVLFRNWCHQLKSGIGNDKVLVLVTTESTCEGNSLLAFILETFSRNTINKTWKSTCFTAKENDINSSALGQTVTFYPDRINFQLITDKSFVVEAQLNHMVAYLCQFDPRLYSVLMLMRYWSHLNPGFFEQRLQTHPPNMCLPFPNCLDWLVVFYLCSKGKIPTPREIQTRPHPPFLDPGTGIDIGFQWDTEFIGQWNTQVHGLDKSLSEQRISSSVIMASLILLHDILDFYGGIADKVFPHVFNTRDGELLSWMEAMQGSELAKWSKMTKQEIALMRSVHRRSSEYVPVARRGLSRIPGVGQLDLERKQFYMIHPIMPHWIIWLPENMSVIFRIMGGTAKDLMKFVRNQAAGESGNISGLNLAAALTYSRR